MVICNLMNVLYIFLYTAPFAFIRYYPFRDKLRVSVKTLCILYAIIICVQASLFCFLFAQPFWNVSLTQVFRMGFAIFYATLSFTLIKENLFKQLYIWFLMFAFGGFIWANANFIEARFFMDFARSFPHATSNLAVILQILIFFPFILKLIDKRIIPMIHSMDSKIWNTVWLIPTLFSLGIFLATASLKFEKVSSLSYLLIRNFCFLSMIFVSIVLFEVLRQTADNARLLENVSMTERQLSLERQHYHMLAEHIEETKRIRHDLRHHLSLINAYISNDDMEKLKEYVEKYQLTLPQEAVISLCENYTVNVIVLYYLELAQVAEIDVDIQLKLPKTMGVADSDLCIVFGNLLENAIEACKRQKDLNRFITISAAIVGNNVVITVDNSFENDIIKEDEGFLSSKRTGKGIGITSIQAVAQKYDGITRFEYVGNVFQASVMLQADKL